MGRGIALLILEQMALCKHEFTLRLVDTFEPALKKTLVYLRAELTSFAEKKINFLRQYFADRADLVSNEEIIREFVRSALVNVQWGSELKSCRNSTHVFEAILEDEAAKAGLFQELESLTKVNPWYFTNTSAIPIGSLAARGNISGRLIGMHFYNPPAVQKLLEIIEPEGIDPKLSAFGEGFAGMLGKRVVFSADVAGFIGNGHFLREICYAADQKSAKQVWQMNEVTEKFLLRPMGIFRLIDYVGPDVLQNAAQIMREHLGIALPIYFLEDCKRCFAYEEGRAVAVMDPESVRFVPIDPLWKEELGCLPKGWRPWKEMKPDQARSYLEELRGADTLGARMAQHFLAHSLQIGKKLVQDGVAASLDDVDTVLKFGFYHLYGLGDLASFEGEG